jgi:opacity protein-like surface antigen
VSGVSRLLFACAIGTLGSVPSLQAQGAQFSLGAGAGIPLGTFDDVVKLGWQATGAVSYAPGSLPVSLQLDGTYSQFSDESPFDIKSQLIYGTADAVYRFQSAASTRFRPYIIAGVGVYNSKATGADALGGSATNFGLNAGAGLDFRAGKAALFLEGRFHNVFSAGPNIEFIPINLGVRFGG